VLPQRFSGGQPLMLKKFCKQIRTRHNITHPITAYNIHRNIEKLSKEINLEQLAEKYLSTRKLRGKSQPLKQQIAYAKIRDTLNYSIVKPESDSYLNKERHYQTKIAQFQQDRKILIENMQNTRLTSMSHSPVTGELINRGKRQGKDSATNKENINNAINNVQKCKNDLSQVTKELNNFKKKNSLDVPANMPDKDKTWWDKWELFIYFLMAETVLNSMLFFAETSSLGIIGGIMEAGLISLINIVLFGILGGHTLRHIGLGSQYFQHQSVVRKIIIGTWALILILLVLSFNLAAGQYRDVLLLNSNFEHDIIEFPKNTIYLSKEALTQLIENPFTMEGGIVSWLFFFIGIIFFCLATWKAYLMDDPYPGYGSREKRVRKYEENLKKHRKQASKKLDKYKNHSRTSIDKNQYTALELLQNELGERRIRQDNVKQTERLQQSIRRASEQLLMKYRDMLMDAYEDVWEDDLKQMHIDIDDIITTQGQQDLDLENSNIKKYEEDEFLKVEHAYQDACENIENDYQSILSEFV